MLDHPRQVEADDAQTGSYLGPAFSDDQIRSFLDGCGAKYHFVADEGQPNAIGAASRVELASPRTVADLDFELRQAARQRCQESTS